MLLMACNQQVSFITSISHSTSCRLSHTPRLPAISIHQISLPGKCSSSERNWLRLITDAPRTRLNDRSHAGWSPTSTRTPTMEPSSSPLPLEHLNNSCRRPAEVQPTPPSLPEPSGRHPTRPGLRRGITASTRFCSATKSRNQGSVTFPPLVPNLKNGPETHTDLQEGKKWVALVFVLLKQYNTVQSRNSTRNMSYVHLKKHKLTWAVYISSYVKFSKKALIHNMKFFLCCVFRTFNYIVQFTKGVVH